MPPSLSFSGTRRRTTSPRVHPLHPSSMCYARVPRLHLHFTLITMSATMSTSTHSSKPSTEWSSAQSHRSQRSIDQWASNVSNVSTSSDHDMTVEAVENVDITSDSKPLPPLPLHADHRPAPPPPTRSSTTEPIIILPDPSPPSSLPRTPMPPLPSVKAAIPAAMCDTPAFLPPSPPSPSPEYELPETPPVAEHDVEGADGAQDKEQMQAQMAQLRAEIAVLQRDLGAQAR